MLPSHSQYLPIFLIGLPWLANALNIENNACTSVEAYHTWSVNKKCYYNPDVLSDAPTMAERHNYTTVTYYVTTDDGYILTVFRILSKKIAEAKRKHNPPIFLQHGAAANSAEWVAIGNRSLAFNLADLGYDVWLGNVRGLTYSNKNINLTVNDPEYWNFNLDTMAQKDISGQLNLVANETGKGGYIIYIGHSLGTTLGFMYGSAYYKEAKKLIQGIVALAPVVYLNNVKAIEQIEPILLPLLKLLGDNGIKGLVYQEDFIHKFVTSLCYFIPEECNKWISSINGKTVEFEAADLLLYYSYWPSGISIYMLLQYLQIYKSGTFQKFDYGATDNSKIYGSTKPPTYNLTNIKIPVHLYYGLCDPLYNKTNLDRLFNELGSTDKVIHKVISFV